MSKWRKTHNDRITINHLIVRSSVTDIMLDGFSGVLATVEAPRDSALDVGHPNNTTSVGGTTMCQIESRVTPSYSRPCRDTSRISCSTVTANVDVGNLMLSEKELHEIFGAIIWLLQPHAACPSPADVDACAHLPTIGRPVLIGDRFQHRGALRALHRSNHL